MINSFRGKTLLRYVCGFVALGIVAATCSDLTAPNGLKPLVAISYKGPPFVSAPSVRTELMASWARRTLVGTLVEALAGTVTVGAGASVVVMPLTVGSRGRPPRCAPSPATP